MSNGVKCSCCWLQSKNTAKEDGGSLLLAHRHSTHKEEAQKFDGAASSKGFEFKLTCVVARLCKLVKMEIVSFTSRYFSTLFEAAPMFAKRARSHWRQEALNGAETLSKAPRRGHAGTLVAGNAALG